jgi:hypothetical protein
MLRAMRAPRPPRPPRPPARKAFTAFAGSVLVLHTVAIILWRVLGIARRPSEVQNGFALAWVALTLVLVFLGLRRVRAARRAGEG